MLNKVPDAFLESFDNVTKNTLNTVPALFSLIIMLKKT
jgi:hypothetical protein